jgi:hypothetical protein
MAQLRPVSLPAVIKDMADNFFARFMKGCGSKRVVKWDSGGRNVRPGPGIIDIIGFIAIIVIILIIAIIVFH